MPSRNRSVAGAKLRDRCINSAIDQRLSSAPLERKYQIADRVRLVKTGLVTTVQEVKSYGLYILVGCGTDEFPASAIEPADPP